MSDTKDLYSILETNKNASDDEIKKAYKKSALKHHPDRNPNNPEATAKFQEVGKAFATLGDPEKRKRYDQFGVIDGENDGQGNGMGGMNPFDIFQNMFNGGAGVRGEACQLVTCSVVWEVTEVSKEILRVLIKKSL